MLKLLHYEATTPALWQGRADSLPHERFFQHVKCVDIRRSSLKNAPQIAFAGFCSDEGIQRNEGRLGAKKGPYQLRQQLAKLACHSKMSFIDVGNVVCDDGDLETAQKEFAKLIHHCHQEGIKTIAFGGGHEIAWPHFQGLQPHYPKLGIINIDAHFDLRPLPPSQLGTSGTPFWQIHQHCEALKQAFGYCCLGIQPAGNTRSLFKRAQDLGVKYLTAEQINLESLAWQTAFLNDFMRQYDYLYLTICLDAFAESAAPGVSAPQALGLSPWQVAPLLKCIAQSGKVVGIDIAELSPPLDSEQKTSRLAAVIIAELLNLKEYTNE